MWIALLRIYSKISNFFILLQIVGWGKTENDIDSPTLLETSLPYFDHKTCRNMFKCGFESYVTIDKFCAGSALGNNIWNH